MSISLKLAGYIHGIQTFRVRIGFIVGRDMCVFTTWDTAASTITAEDDMRGERERSIRTGKGASKYPN